MHVERYIQSRQAQGITGDSLNKELGMIRRAYKIGQRGNRPKVRTAPYFPRFAGTKRDGFIEIEQHDRFREACRTVRRGGEWFVGVFETGYTYGWRHSEIISLLVEQIRFRNPDEGYIAIPGAWTKNGMPRQVAFARSWCPWLVETFERAIEGKSRLDFVFLRGKHLDTKVGRFDKLWRTANRVAQGPAGFRFHDLRRTAARNLRRAGFTDLEIQDICGWETASVMRSYLGRDVEHLESKMAKLGELWERERQGRADVVQQGKMSKRDPMRADAGTDRPGIGRGTRKSVQNEGSSYARQTPANNNKQRGLKSGEGA